jgi:hypothetical protein
MLAAVNHRSGRCDGKRVMRDDLLDSPDALLARAAEHDARRAHEVIARIPNPHLLEVVLSQALLAVEDGRTRTAGIDAIAELERASVELMGMTQSVAAATEDDLPLVTGWELLTLSGAEELVGATTSVHARPWHLALIAFDDTPLRDGVERRVTAVTADMRFVGARLRIEHGRTDAVVLDACVSDRLDDLGRRTSLGWGLWCALAGAVELR